MNKRNAVHATAGQRGHGSRLLVGRAFTLIELLVVVSIIALLISILLPSLKRARDQAKGVACQSNIGGIMRGVNIYASEWNGWIPGSPGTSGSVLYNQGYPEDDYYEEIPGKVSQVWDWAGPIANSAMPNNRGTRLNTITEELFVCPANQYTSEPFPDGPKGTFVNQRMMSYNAIRQFLLWSPLHPEGFDLNTTWGEPAPFPEAQYENQIGGPTLLPRGYKPNLDRIASPSNKVYIADGSRYTDDSVAPVILDHDVAWNAAAGGAFADGGPTLNKLYLRSYKEDQGIGRYSYRHAKSGNWGAILVGRCDGSAALLGELESRFPDWWFPKGTLIPWASEFNDRTKKTCDPNTSSFGIYDYQVQQ